MSHPALSRLKKSLVIGLVVSWPVLFLWNFSSARAFALETILHGSASRRLPALLPSPASFFPLSAFHPRSELVPPQETKPAQPAFPVIEFHGHLMGPVPENLEELLERQRIRLFVNLALLTETADEYQKLKERFPTKRIIHFATLNWKLARHDPDFGRAMARELEKSARMGLKGVKLWKNFGLTEKDPQGRRIPLSDRRLDPVWEICRRYKLLVAMHTADPPAFFRPVDGRNERFGELSRHPEWSFYGGEFPSFDTLLGEREELFRRNRNVTFVALHFGELAHDLGAAAGLLDRNPNVHFDSAQRIDELGRHPRETRRFFLRYQDRILYGTDGLPDYKKDRIYWRFFETEDEYFDYHPHHKPRKGLWKINGIALPPRVLKKIYYENAARLLGL